MPSKLFQRIVLGLTLISSISTVYFGVQVAGGWPIQILEERGTDAIKEQTFKLLYQEAKSGTIEKQLETLLNENDRDWIAIHSLQDIANSLGHTLPREQILDIEKKYNEDHKLASKIKNCGKCVWEIGNCDFQLLLLCRTPVDFTPVGDVTSLGRAGANFFGDKEIDKIELGLSIIGLTSTFLAPATGGQSYFIKTGASTIKIGLRTKRLAKAVHKPIETALMSAIDFKKLTQVRKLDQLRGLVDYKAAKPALNIISLFGALRKNLGTKNTLYLAKNLNNKLELKQAASISKALGRKTIGAITLLGKNKLLKRGLKLSKTILGLTLSTIFFLLNILYYLFKLFLYRNLSEKR